MESNLSSFCRRALKRFSHCVAFSLVLLSSSHLQSQETLWPFSICSKESKNKTKPLSTNPASTIRGWPNYLAMGTVTNDAADFGPSLSEVPVDAIFKYAGNNGAGDRGQIILNDPALIQTIQIARYAEKNKKTEIPSTIMPVMVVYTINASGGIYSATDDVLNDTYLMDHYINLIDLCLVAESYKDSKHPNPATFIVNPDFMGAIQQAGQWGPLQPNTPVHVNRCLAQAIRYFGIDVTLPYFDDTLTGYIQSINWTIHYFGPDIPFGWVQNLWAAGSANWIHSSYSTAIVDSIINYMKQLGVYSGEYSPDFLAFDRFERDDFYIQKTQWFYNRRDWKNYIRFLNDVSRAFSVPAIAWQIPGGHLLTKSEENPVLSLDHVATAPDFFFGDPNVTANVFPNNIQDAVLSFPLDPIAYDSKPATAKDYLVKDVNTNWDISPLEYVANSNIRAILWGGGSTTAVISIGTNGDDGGWLANKTQNYYKSPVIINDRK